MTATRVIDDHLELANIGSKTHAQIDSHIANMYNPHNVTKAQIGLGNVKDGADVTGPSSSTDGHVALFNGTTGKIIKESGISLGSVAAQNSDAVSISGGTITGISVFGISDPNWTSGNGADENHQIMLNGGGGGYDRADFTLAAGGTGVARFGTYGGGGNPLTYIDYRGNLKFRQGLGGDVSANLTSAGLTVGKDLYLPNATIDAAAWNPRILVDENPEDEWYGNYTAYYPYMAFRLNHLTNPRKTAILIQSINTQTDSRWRVNSGIFILHASKQDNGHEVSGIVSTELGDGNAGTFQKYDGTEEGFPANLPSPTPSRQYGFALEVGVSGNQTGITVGNRQDGGGICIATAVGIKGGSEGLRIYPRVNTDNLDTRYAIIVSAEQDNLSSSNEVFKLALDGTIYIPNDTLVKMENANGMYVEALRALSSGNTLRVGGGFAGGISLPSTGISGTLTIRNPLAIAYGGTGADTVAGARTNLGLGSIATQDSNSVSISGGTITGVSLTGDTAIYVNGTGSTHFTAQRGGVDKVRLEAVSTGDTRLEYSGVLYFRAGVGGASKVSLNSAGDIKLLSGCVDAYTGFKVDGTAGVSGSFTTADSKTVTVTKGIITSIA